MANGEPVDQQLVDVVRAEIEHLNELRRLVLEQHSHSYKWLTASLLAINGGGAVAVLNGNNLDAWTRIKSGSAFSIGIILSLLIAVLAQRLISRTLPPIQRQIGYWISVIHDGTRLEDFEAQLGQEAKAATKWAWIVPTVGWVAAMFFVLGLLIVGLGIASSGTPVVIDATQKAGVIFEGASSPCDLTNDR